MSEDAEKTYIDFTSRGYTDGLPIIPPTEARVEKMLGWSDRKPDDSLGRVPPSEDEATVQAVAINAVMAGCRPEYFPVVLTEIETLLDRPNLRGTLATTGGCWPMAVVNGPIAREIGMYSSWGLFGTGPLHQANLTIGRTMTLVCQNVGKSMPGLSEKKPMYNMGRYGICIAEDEEHSPWEPLHVDKGFRKETSTVTVFDMIFLWQWHLGGGRPSGIFDIDRRREAKRLVESHLNPSTGITPQGDASLYVCAPSQAKLYADNGWSKQDFKNFFYENCRSNPQEWYREYPEYIREDIMRTAFSMAPTWMRMGESVPLFRSPEDIWVVVAGAIGGGWSVAAWHGGHPGVIKQIALTDGTPAKSVKDFQHK